MRWASDATVPLGVARERLQALGPVQGNLDPVRLRVGGTAMAEAARGIGSLPRCATARSSSISAHGVLPETPPVAM